MDMIKTKSFELAALVKGDPSSDKVAILLPGRLDTKDYANFSSHLDYLAGKGFYSLAIDPPGTWDSPGGIELFTTTNYVKAVNELVDLLGGKPTLVMGHSRGGAVALLAASKNFHIKGLVMVMPALGAPTPPKPESLERGYDVSYRDLPPGTSQTQEQKVFNLPLTYFSDGQKYDTIDTIKHLQKPKLILYGKKDEFITPEEVEEILVEMPDPKMSKMLNSPHDYRYYPEVIDEVNELIGQFVDEYFVTK